MSSGIEFLQTIFHESQNEEIVKSKEYIEWLYNFVSQKGSIDDELVSYQCEGIDKEYGSLISTFFYIMIEKANEENIKIYTEDECAFPNQIIYIQMKDKYFKLLTMHGQGSWTKIALLDKEPQKEYIKKVL